MKAAPGEGFERRVALRLAAASAAALFARPRTARAAGDAEAPVALFPLAVHRAKLDDGTPVVTDAWLLAQLASANALFRPFGVGFALASTNPLEGVTGRLETRDDRDHLAPLARAFPRSINVFLVEALRDVDDLATAHYRMGVHWRLRADTTRRYVIVSRIAAPTVLAHELGHYFGNGHSAVRNNVMSYLRDEGKPVAFDAAQGARIRAEAKAIARELSPATPR